MTWLICDFAPAGGNHWTNVKIVLRIRSLLGHTMYVEGVILTFGGHIFDRITPTLGKGSALSMVCEAKELTLLG